MKKNRNYSDYLARESNWETNNLSSGPRNT